MSNFTITIIGAGVIGASLGLALKREKDAPRLLVHDKDLGNAKAAVKLGAFDKAEWNLINACEQADLIILAIPLNGIRPTLEAIAPYLKEGALVSDTSRSKAPVLAWAESLLPAHVHFIGGDPLIHASGSGYTHATAELFQNRLYCLTPAPRAAEAAVQLMVGLVTMLGAEPFFLDVAEHDGLMAAVNYLPALTGVALVNTLSDQASWREMRKLAGNLFEQASAGVADNPADLKDTFLTNRENLLRWLDSYLAQLQQLRSLLVEADPSDERLAQILDKVVAERLKWLVDYHEGYFMDPELEQPKIEKQGLMKQLIGFEGLRKRLSNPPPKS